MGLLGSVFGLIGGSKAASALASQYHNAEEGMINATNAAVGGIENQIGTNYTNVNKAGDNVNAATGQANGGLQDILSQLNGQINPYIQGGQQGAQQLQQYAASNPQFKFNLNDYFNSPAYNFQLQKGEGAIQNQLAAQGIGAGSNAAQQMEDYGQALASTYYNQAFNQAQSTFQTNQNTTLSNLSALINSGLAGQQLSNQANMGIGGQIAGNTIGAANTNAGLQEVLAQLGLQGQVQAGNLGLEGNLQAGKFAVGQGEAQAAGDMATWNNLGGIVQGGLGLLSGIPGVGNLLNTGFSAGGQGNTIGGILNSIAG